MSEEFDEYTIFTVTDRNGNEVEMAVIDEFEFDHKEYVAAAQVDGDILMEDGVFIFKVKDTEEFEVEKITDADEYAKVSESYINMD